MTLHNNFEIGRDGASDSPAPPTNTSNSGMCGIVTDLIKYENQKVVKTKDVDFNDPTNTPLKTSANFKYLHEIRPDVINKLFYSIDGITFVLPLWGDKTVDNKLILIEKGLKVKKSKLELDLDRIYLNFQTKELYIGPSYKESREK